MPNMTEQTPGERFNAQARAANWATRIDERMAFQAPALQAVRRLWDAIAADGRLPGRGAFTVRILKPYLRQFGVISIEAKPGCAPRYRSRYVGTGLADVFGEFTGLYFEDFLPASTLPRTLACYDAVVAGRRPVRVLTRFQHEKANFLAAELFAAPLADDGCTPNMVMTVTQFSRPSERGADAWRLEAAFDPPLKSHRAGLTI